MILLTPSTRARLLANGRTPDADHIPVVRFFNPFGAGTWLATELNEDGDILFGLADLGYPELGSWSLSEMAAIRLPFGLGIERDLHFEGRYPISVWAEAARTEGSISAAERVLYARAQEQNGAFRKRGVGEAIIACGSPASKDRTALLDKGAARSGWLPRDSMVK